VKGNADMDLCFHIGFLVRRSHCDTVVIGSGDGDLCVAVGRGLRRLPGRALQILTLSVPGATSHRLRSRTDLFDGNIALGQDVALSQRQRRRSMLPKHPTAKARIHHV